MEILGFVMKLTVGPEALYSLLAHNFLCLNPTHV